MKIYEALAKVFHTLDLGTCFALLGDANMHWAGALSDLGARFIYTRHEHARSPPPPPMPAILASGVCNGDVWTRPTQVMTILPIAVRRACHWSYSQAKRRCIKNGTTK